MEGLCKCLLVTAALGVEAVTVLLISVYNLLCC